MGKRGKKPPGWATAKALEELGRKYSTKEISVVLEVPLSTIQWWVKKLNVVTRSRKVRNEDA